MACADDEFIQPPSGPGPITFDPAHPYISSTVFRENPRPSFRVADLTNPILQPWTRERLRKVNERSLSGQVVAIPKERCWPVGVPHSWCSRRRRCISCKPRKTFG